MKFFIIGRGQLGSALAKFLQDRGHEIFQPELDARDADALKFEVSKSVADIVVNTAAKTNIDWCEENKLEAFNVNTLGAINSADAAKGANAFFVQISSGCVQESEDGEHPISEDDPPNPACFYSWAKVFADEMLLLRLYKREQELLILRPRQLLSAIPHPRNILAKFLTYNKFIDTDNSYTIIEDLLPVIEGMAEKRLTGLYNAVNDGYLSPYKVALILKQNTKPDMEFEKISREEFDKMVRNKRVDCVLKTDKLRAAGFGLPKIKVRLPGIAQKLKENLKGASDIMRKTQEETKSKIIGNQ